MPEGAETQNLFKVTPNKEGAKVELQNNELNILSNSRSDSELINNAVKNLLKKIESLNIILSESTDKSINLLKSDFWDSSEVNQKEANALASSVKAKLNTLYNNFLSDLKMLNVDRIESGVVFDDTKADFINQLSNSIDSYVTDELPDIIDDIEKSDGKDKIGNNYVKDTMPGKNTYYSAQKGRVDANEMINGL